MGGLNGFLKGAPKATKILFMGVVSKIEYQISLVMFFGLILSRYSENFCCETFEVPTPIKGTTNLPPPPRRLQSGNNGKIMKRDLGGNPDPVLAHHLERLRGKGWKRKIECSPTLHEVMRSEFYPFQWSFIHYW